MTISRTTWRALIGSVLSAGLACSSGADSGAVSIIAIRGVDYAYVMPDSVPTGLVRFVFTDEGPSPHQMIILQVGQSVSLSDVFDELRGGRPYAQGIRLLGGTEGQGPRGGPDSSVTVLLEPGRYVMVCALPTDEGVPHFERGMVREFVAVGNAGASGNLPYDVEMVMSDYAYALSASLVSGRQTIKLTNVGPQAHHAVILRSPAGADLMALLQIQSDQLVPVVATTAMDPGEELFVTVDLIAGDYAILCFIPDVGDGRPHVDHGMLTTFTVRGAA